MARRAAQETEAAEAVDYAEMDEEEILVQGIASGAKKAFVESGGKNKAARDIITLLQIIKRQAAELAQYQTEE